ncbi:head-tail adaptor protein [Tardiphaga sp. 42S5]|uniref:head-tail adaptor protein n=1 Tax=Tardiphaga sp. 42S5 TaxID=1404799 RepID=UPI002A599451|nr:head-tail adaptor protein [Tardiphaga sp. 42S5]WPO39007.1 head-tail adaptor protein [Tardiphaga sp. 42S5]
MIDPGRLKTRLVIEAPIEADDGQGGVTRNYSAVATVWAAVLPARMTHAVEADADGALVHLRIILRSGFALTLRHRFIDAAKIYRITALREIDERRFVEIDAEWRID